MSDSARSRHRADAQRRVNRIRAFRAELDALLSSGAVTLTDEQRDAIEHWHDGLLRTLSAHHDVDRTDSAGRLSRGIQIASFFAAVALTAAIYSLVSRFWGRLDLPLQATLLCAFPLMALVGVELAAQRERSLYIASIFALAAFGTYWLAVGELSVLLNVPLTPPAIFGGALFGLGLALPYGFRLIFAGGLVALLVAVAGMAFQVAGMPWVLTAEHPEVLTLTALLLALLAPRLQPVNPPFAAVLRVVTLAIGFLGLLLLSTAGRASVLPLPAAVIQAIYQAVMLVLCVAALVVGVRKQWMETVYVSAGALTLFLFVRFVDWFWEALPRYLFFLLLAAIAFGWLLVLRRLRHRLTTEAE